MVLREHNEAPGRNIARAAAMAASAKFGILAGIDEPVAIGFRQLTEIAVISVVALKLTGQQCAQAVMKVVIPQGIQAVSAALALAYQTRIVVGALGDQIDRKS